MLVAGGFCGECANYLGDKQPKCPGCAVIRERPFWGECAVYACLSSRGLGHCGLCGDFPCERLIGQFDPNNPERQRNAVYRAGLLAYRANHGDEKTLTLIEKLRKKTRAK